MTLKPLSRKQALRATASMRAGTATLADLQRLQSYRMRRFGLHGCMAYLDDLREVEAALSSIGA